MDFPQLIIDFRESNSTQSPIWIWFSKQKEDFSMCHICDSKIAVKNSSTTNLIAHLKGHHGFFKKYNAWKEYEELSSLKDERLKNLKRKNRLNLSICLLYFCNTQFLNELS